MPYASALARQVYSREYNRTHGRESRRLYRIANREKINAQKREDYKKYKDKYDAYGKKWKAANAEKVKATHKFYHLFTKYGLSKEQWQRLMLNQNYCCAICDKNITNKPCVDHSHDTGEVRGLLCDACNTGLGHFKDSTAILNKAIAYLNKKEN